MPIICDAVRFTNDYYNNEYSTILIVGFAQVGKTQIINALIARNEVADRTRRGLSHFGALDATVFHTKVAYIDTAGEDYQHIQPNDPELRQFIELLHTIKQFLSGLILVIDLTRDDVELQVQTAKNLLVILRSLYTESNIDVAQNKVDNPDPVHVNNELRRLKRIPIPILVLFSKADDARVQPFRQQPPFFIADPNIAPLRIAMAQHAKFFHIDFCHAIKVDYDTGVVVTFDGGVVPVIQWWLKTHVTYSKRRWRSGHPPTRYLISLQKFLDKYVIFGRRNRW